MSSQRVRPRREFLRRVATGTGLAFFGMRPGRALAEPPPETTSVTLSRGSSLCMAPQYIADALLAAEGFTEVKFRDARDSRYRGPKDTKPLSSAGGVNIMMEFAGPILMDIDAGEPVVVLGGGHVGCLELFAHDTVRGVRDLKSKTVAVFAAPPHVFLVTVMAHVGLDARKDVRITWHSQPEARRAFEERKADAFIASPPAAQELRAKRIGRVIVNSSTDRPWSQYFCCVVAANRDWVRAHPVAAKRAMRALLKSADVCALEPARAARALVERGFTDNYQYAEQAMRDVPYGKWRDYDAEDTLRFYALRLHEAGMIKSSPQRLIAQGTDWRFFNELRRELKS